ncbi:MAG TPA: histidine kinase [Nitrospirales bacterium]|jgi:PleD family two-component response regulator
MENKNVLVAVNDVFFYTKLRDALKPHGYNLEKARSQEDVTEKAQALNPVAIVLNINDESLDAFKAIEGLKENDRSKSIPILAFANHEDVESWKRAQKLGVTKVVSRNEFSSKTLALLQEVIASGKAAVLADAGRVGEKT